MPVFKLITPSDRTETRTEVTRVVVKDPINGDTLKVLLDKLRKLHGQTSGQFFLSWFDGTDYCTIRDAEDLMEAAAFFEESESKDKAVRLYASADKTGHQSIFGSDPVQQEPEKPTGKVDTEESEPEDVPEPLLDNEEQDLKLAQALDAALNSSVPAEETVPVPTAVVPPNPEAGPNVPIHVPHETAQYAHYPAYPYGPYAMQPPYGYYYNNMASPMYTPYTPPMMANKAEIAPINVEPPVMIPKERRESVPDAEMLQKINHFKPPEIKSQPKPIPAPVPQPMSRPKPSGRTSEKEKRRQYVSKALATLREMGYLQDERELKKLIKENKGNINVIIDKMESQQK